MKKILVTGAGGYIGIPLCETLIHKGYHVVGLDRYYFGREIVAPVAENNNFTMLVDDIRYFDLSILKDVNAVIDLAGLSNDASAEIDPNLTKAINTNGAIRVIEAAKAAGIRRYIYASSASVYGHGETSDLNEKSNCFPQTQYAISKQDVENVLLEKAGPDFEVVILRNATVFGLAPRMRLDLAVNIMTYRAWKERTIYVMGGGNQWRPFVHVNDVVAAMILSLEAPSEKVAGEIFNVGSSDMNYQIKHIAQLVLDAVPDTKVHMIPDDDDQRTYNLNFDKIHNVLGFKRSYNIEDGIDEIKKALARGDLDGDDPTCYTLQWYKSLIEWSERINTLALNGDIL
ncbi:MAG TPA: SDR family oxidoreductase [Rhodospirillales bacterium]|nr:SDR family oxidoreductase [Rhodospirillales bacterium]